MSSAQPKPIKTGTLKSEISNTIYDDEIKTKGGIIDALTELIDNAFDYNADKIIINHDHDVIKIIENGIGFAQKNMNAFASMRVSTSRGDINKKGMFGKGSKAAHGVFQKIIVETIRNDELDSIYSFKFTPEQFKTALFGGKKIGYEVFQRRDFPDFPIVSGSGSVITGEGFQPRKYMNPDEVIKKLSERLRPFVAKTVIYNDKPLPERKIIGTIIERSVRAIDLIGEIQSQIYIPEKLSKDDRLMITAQGSGCELRTLIANMPRTLTHKISPIFSLPNVCGIIEIPSLKKWLLENRDGFNAELYCTNEIEVIIDWLNLELAPEIQENMGYIEHTKDIHFIEKTFDSVTAEINQAYHHKPAGLSDVPDISLRLITTNIRRIELETGSMAIFRITQFDNSCSGKFAWDSTKCGGQITPEAGQMVEYTAGDEEGNFSLTVFDAEDASKKAIIRIRLVHEKEFKTSPSHVDIEPDDSIKIMARNTSRTSNELTWDASDSGGVVNSSTGNMIRYTAGPELGEYRLMVYDQLDHSKKAYCCINIVSEKEEKSKPPGLVGEFRIRDIIFVLGKTTLSRNPSTSFLSRGETVHTLNINISHVAAERAREKGETVFKQYLFDEIVSQFGQLSLSHLTGDALIAELGAVKKEIIEGVDKKN